MEPRPASAPPPCPKLLGKIARKHWNYVIGHLQTMNTLGESDQGTIMAAAIAYGQVADIQAEIDRLAGLPELDDDNYKRLDSQRRLMNQTMNALVKYEAELGLNPTARTRIKLDKPVTQTRRERLLS